MNIALQHVLGKQALQEMVWAIDIDFYYHF